ncbi:MAG: polysaccharide deacetylase family protein [Mobilitalea sp.]
MELQTEITQLHRLYGMSTEEPDHNNYAYAAEIETNQIISPTSISITPASTISIMPTITPTISPTITPIVMPTIAPTKSPTITPAITPTVIPSSGSNDNLNSPITEPPEKPTTIPSPTIKPQHEVTEGIYKDKQVYLTFDDGPSIYTDEILDILQEYGIKATFFVVGKTDEHSIKMYKRIVNEGHTLGMHSYSHRYEKIYNSVKDFDKDFTKLWKLLYDTTGYKPSIYRFPGGSANEVNKHDMKDFIKYLNDADMVYFDWNVLNGDATGVTYTEEQLVENVLGGVEAKKRSIVLMHDSQSKKTTVDSLPTLLDDLLLGGAELLPLNKDVPPIQMIKADSVKE